MNSFSNAWRAVLIAPLFSLSSCLDKSPAVNVAALESEALDLQRTLDRIASKVDKLEKEESIARHRAKHFELEQLAHFNAQTDKRTKIELLKSQIGEMQAEFQDYKEACVVGTLNLE